MTDILVVGKVLLAVIVFYSCSNLTINDQVEKTKTHKRLIDCISKFVMEDGGNSDGFHNNYDNFIKDYFSKKQNGDTLIITTLFEVNACGQTIGDIEFYGDTLFLKTKHISDEVCTSIRFEKFIFRIHNPNNEKYKIITKK